MYGKLTEGKIIHAPSSVIYGDKRIINPTEDVLLSLGYYPITHTAPPVTEDGYRAVGGWEQTENEIVRTWTIEQYTEEQSMEERIKNLEEELRAAKILLGVSE